MDPTIRDLVSRIIEKLQPSLPESPLPLPERLSAALWPYLTDAADPVASPAPELKDQRVKPWQVRIHFWASTPTGPELVASTDPEVIRSTTTVVKLVPKYAEELHELIPDPLQSEEVRGRLTQLRNNLARASGAALRIPYTFEGQDYLCQVDVLRLSTL